MGAGRGSERTDRSRWSAKEHPVLVLDTDPVPHHQEDVRVGEREEVR